MSCPKTQHLLTEYFDEGLTSLARLEMDRHLQSCPECAAELRTLLQVREELTAWKDARVPHWDRGMTLYRQEHAQRLQSPRSLFWQWLPVTASLAMLCLLLFNVSFVVEERGFRVAFGSQSGVSIETVEQRLAQFAQQQQESQQAFLARMEERQDDNNLRLIQAVMTQTEEVTAENFERIYTYFEQQRQRDLDTMQASYQQLVDSDFDTLRSMQQLASFVRFQGEAR